MTATLLASAGTIDGITKMINKFWYSDAYSVNPETLAIQHPTRVPEGFIVRKVRGRYRFESV